jgi:hypothetical protein
MPEKIGKIVTPPMDLSTASVGNLASLEKDLQTEAKLQEMLKRAEQPPREKFEFPMTDAQEIGWYVTKEVHRLLSVSTFFSFFFFFFLFFCI